MAQRIIDNFQTVDIHHGHGQRKILQHIHVMHLFFIKLAVVDSGQRIMHASVPEVSLSLLQFRNIRDHAPEQIAAHQFLYAWDLHLFPITVGGYHDIPDLIRPPDLDFDGFRRFLLQHSLNH